MRTSRWVIAAYAAIILFGIIVALPNFLHPHRLDAALHALSDAVLHILLERSNPTPSSSTTIADIGEAIGRNLIAETEMEPSSVRSRP